MLGIIATHSQGGVYLSPELREALGHAGEEPAAAGRLADFADPAEFEKACRGERGGRLALRASSGERIAFETRPVPAFSDGWRCLEVFAEGKLDFFAEANPGLELLATASHELRVPLNGVIGFSHLLGNTALDADQKLFLEKLQSCNYLLKGLINDILEYARVASAKVDLRSEPLGLEGFVKELGGLFHDRAERKGLTLLVEADASLRKRASLPKLRVTQVASNLLSNAIKFTERGWVRLSARVVADGPVARLEIAVDDSGPGIAAEDRDRVFLPFGQVRSAATREAEGSGLGLAISRGLVELMGGEIALAAGAEGGSRFAFSLPVELESADASLASPPPASKSVRSRARPPRPSALERRHVLIVEDNKLNADILSHFLRDYGATFEVAETGQKAVEMYEDGKYDLVLMDIMLPELDGYQASERILAKSTLKTSVPIIGVTAKVFRSDQARCFAAGMVEVLNKPVDFQRLREAIERYVKPRTPEAPAPAPVAAPPEEAARALDVRAVESYLERMTPEGGSRRATAAAALEILDDEARRLGAACEAGDAKEISLRAHSLKGALSLLGARNAADLAKGLEMTASRGDVALRAGHWRRMIQDAYEAYKRALDRHLGSDAERVEPSESRKEVGR